MYQPSYHSTEATDTGARANARVAHANAEKVPAQNGNGRGVDQPTRPPSNGRPKPASAPPRTDPKASPPSRTTPSPTWQRRSSFRTRRTEVSAVDDETGDVTLLSTARHHLNRTRTARREDLTRMPAPLRTSTECYHGPASVVAARDERPQRSGRKGNRRRRAGRATKRRSGQPAHRHAGDRPRPLLICCEHGHIPTMTSTTSSAQPSRRAISAIARPSWSR